MAKTLSQRLLTPAHTRARTAARLIGLLGVACALVVMQSGCAKPEPTPEERAAQFVWPEGPHPQAEIRVTGVGTLHLELYPEIAPRTVENFVKLAEQGFYDGTTFHRIIPGYMLQGGDPNTRDDDPDNDGRGGPGYTIDDEVNPIPHVRGVISMANSGRRNTAGSQFFIVHEDALGLDGTYSAFGRVRSEDLPILDRLTEVEIDEFGRWGPASRPIHPLVIEHVAVHRDGAGQTAAAGTPSTGTSADVPAAGGGSLDLALDGDGQP